MNELEQKVKNYTDEESDGFTSDEWDDLLAGRKANFNSRLIYSDENLNINDIVTGLIHKGMKIYFLIMNWYL